MENITYVNTNRSFVEVFLNKKHVGNIVRVAGGYQYRPKNVKSTMYGQCMSTIELVKQSLETEM